MEVLVEILASSEYHFSTCFVQCYLSGCYLGVTKNRINYDCHISCRDNYYLIAVWLPGPLMCQYVCSCENLLCLFLRFLGFWDQILLCGIRSSFLCLPHGGIAIMHSPYEPQNFIACHGANNLRNVSWTYSCLGFSQTSSHCNPSWAGIQAAFRLTLKSITFAHILWVVPTWITELNTCSARHSGTYTWNTVWGKSTHK